MQKIVKSVAKLHAHFWQRDDLAEQFWLLALEIDARMRSELMRRSKDRFRTMFSGSGAAGLDAYLMADYKKALRIVLMNLSCVDQIDLGNGRGTKLLEVWIERLRLRLMADSPLS